MIRKIVVGLSLVLGALLISLGLLFPSYVLSQIKERHAKTELSQSKEELNSKLPSDDILEELKVTRNNINSLKPFSNKIYIYSLLRIFESKPQTIKINFVSFVKPLEGESRFVLRGVATDRESLISFAKALESRVEFSAVDLPVSNFAKETNIEFSMTVTIK